MATEVAPPEPNSRKPRRDIGALWRTVAWGAAAAIALAALAFTTQTDSGSERLQLAFAPASPPPAAMASVAPPAPEKDAETKRLQAEVLTLAADRDRLNARIASLERNIDDVTGSIKKQAATAAPVEKPAAPPQPALPTIAPLALPVTTDTSAPWPGVAPAPAAAAAPVQAETRPAEAIPLPPVRVASAAASVPEPPRIPEIGVDLGGARNLDVLNARWVAVKANFGPLLTGLHPLAARDPRPGMPEYRLLVGPLPNRAAAAQLCTRFAAVHVTCRSTKFDGEDLAQR